MIVFLKEAVDLGLPWQSAVGTHFSKDESTPAQRTQTHMPGGMAKQHKGKENWKLFRADLVE